MEARSFPFLELIPIVQSFLTTTSLSLVSSRRIQKRRHVLLPQSLECQCCILKRLQSKLFGETQEKIPTEIVSSMLALLPSNLL